MVAMTEVLLLGWIEVDGSRQLLHLIRRDQRVVDIVAAPDSQRLFTELASRAEDDELVCTPDLGDAAGDAWSIESWTPERLRERALAAAVAAASGALSGVRDPAVIDQLLRGAARLMKSVGSPLVAPFELEHDVRRGIVDAKQTAAGVVIVQGDHASLEIFPSDRTRAPFLADLEAGRLDAARGRERLTLELVRAPAGLASALTDYVDSDWVPVPSRWLGGASRLVTADECALLVAALGAAT
jgi:hypothetical protein